MITKTTAAQAAAGEPPVRVPVSTSSSSSIGESSILGMFLPSKKKKEEPVSTDPTTVATTRTKEKEIPPPPSSFASVLSSVWDKMKQGAPAEDDPFDDHQQLFTAQEKQAIRHHQATTMAQQSLSQVHQPILTQPPAYMTRNQQTVVAPSTTTTTHATTHLTTLDNGIRVVSQPAPGSPVATLGCVSQLASQSETTWGATHALEILDMINTTNDSNSVDDPIEFSAATGREQSLHFTEVWRPRVDQAVEQLARGLTNAMQPSNYDMALQILEFQCQDDNMPMEVLLQEAIQEAAFGKEQPYGKLHYNTLDTVQQLSWPAIADHWQSHVTHNPQGLVLAAVGVDHDHFVHLAEEHLGHLTQDATIQTPPSVYRGGSCVWEKPNTVTPEDDSEVARDKRLSRCAMVWKTGGWHDSQDFVASCIVQSLWGGGSSFSAGGPGKGMYSRLYRTVLNQYEWVEAAEAYAAFYESCGVLGMTGQAPPERVREWCKLMCQHVRWLANKPVPEEELDRAKTMLRCNVLMQLESRLVSFEDLGRQVLTYGRHEPMRETSERIEAVSATDIQELAGRMLAQPPTFAVVGMDLDTEQLPKPQELEQWLR